MARGFVRTETPVVSWSASRMRLLDECARAYHTTYFLAHNGYEPDAPGPTRQAWLLKRLVALDLLGVQSLRTRARALARVLVEGGPLPVLADVMAEARKFDMRPVVDGDPATYLDGRFNPKPMLAERLYRQSMPVADKAAWWKRYRARARALIALPVWGSVRLAHGHLRIGPLKEVDPVATVEGVDAFATPTLWWRDTRDDTVTVLDIRGGVDARSASQLAPYVVAACTAFNVAPSAVRVCSVGLEWPEGMVEIVGDEHFYALGYATIKSGITTLTQLHDEAAQVTARTTARVMTARAVAHEAASVLGESEAPVALDVSAVPVAVVGGSTDDIARILAQQSAREAERHATLTAAAEARSAAQEVQVEVARAMRPLFPMTTNRAKCVSCRLRGACWPTGVHLAPDGDDGDLGRRRVAHERLSAQVVVAQGVA